LVLEILVRSGIMYLAALLVVRFIGKRGLGQLSPFEYLLVVAMGSATGDPMFYPEVPILHGVVVLATLVFLQKSVLNFAERSRPVASLVESTPALLVRDGHWLDDKLKSEDVSIDELLMKLRESGVRDIGEVEFAFLEPSGHLSVFRLRPEAQSQNRSTLPLTEAAS
jgi:uncharacterized membrane protein YcaP (DUF421 family)